MKTKSAKAAFAPVLSSMLGNKVLFNGTFARGEQDRLTAFTEAQQGIVTGTLDASVDILVLADPAKGKTVQQKVKSLNAKGAAIRVMTAADYLLMVMPTAAQMTMLIRGNPATADVIAKISTDYLRTGKPLFDIAGEKFDGLDLSGIQLRAVRFSNCTFVDCVLNDTSFRSFVDCDFSRARGENTSFLDGSASRFHSAEFVSARFFQATDGCDFTGAKLEKSTFSAGPVFRPKPQSAGQKPAVFTGASAPGARFTNGVLPFAVFGRADLTGASFSQCQLQETNFHSAVLNHASFYECSMMKADLSAASLVGAAICDSTLVNATVVDADLASCNLHGGDTRGTDFTKAKNYDPNANPSTTPGPAITELDALATAARRIAMTMVVEAPDGVQHTVGVDSRLLRWGAGLTLPPALGAFRSHQPAKAKFFEAMFKLAGVLAKHRVRFETVEVQSAKSAKTGRALRDVVMNAIAEAFAQPIPPAAELAAAVKAFREQTKEQTAADRERREAAKKLVEKQKQTLKRQMAKKIEKEVGKVTDIATFLKALELRADKSKIDKATKMLKGEKFQLFNDITEAHLNGVVKSQTDADLVYACRIESNGQYACCTQNLNICGGLRGSICKHLLVLIIGLVKAGQLDPGDIDGWIAKTHDTKPELNKETMGEIFIRYKGAEAGEVDWRPTETVPEDYYAV